LFPYDPFVKDIDDELQSASCVEGHGRFSPRVRDLAYSH
jgi:hypothetical protein